MAYHFVNEFGATSQPKASRHVKFKVLHCSPEHGRVNPCWTMLKHNAKQSWTTRDPHWPAIKNTQDGHIIHSYSSARFCQDMMMLLLRRQQDIPDVSGIQSFHGVFMEVTRNRLFFPPIEVSNCSCGPKNTSKWDQLTPVSSWWSWNMPVIIPFVVTSHHFPIWLGRYLP